MITIRPLRRPQWQAAMLALFLAVACSDPTGTSTPSPLTLSDPVLAAALKVTMTGSAVEQVAYVALDPGTIAAGTTATIKDRVSGAERAAPVVNGGFDPIGIPANAGDTLVVSVATANGQVVVASVVARPHPPHVVRVDPPKDHLDVPVNTSLTVVFNEPVNAGTVTAATMQLRQGITMVPGTITGDPARPWLFTFTPNQPLDPGATYTFTVTGTITDPSGLMLDLPATISFSTEAPVASVAITPQVSEFARYVRLTAVAQDAAGNTLAGHAFVWTSSDTSMATVDSTGLVTGRIRVPGFVTITATTGGHSGSETMRVTCAITASQCDAPTFGPATRSVTGTFTHMLPDGTTQPTPNLDYFAWVNVPNVGGYSTGWRQADANGAFQLSVPDGLVSILARTGALAQPCMAVANTFGQNAVVNITVVDSANPLPLRTTTAPAVTGTVYRLINGVRTPVVGAVVQYNTWVPDLVVAETFTDSSGRYTLCNLQFSFPNEQVGYVSVGAWVTVTVSGPGTVDIIVP